MLEIRHILTAFHNQEQIFSFWFRIGFACIFRSGFGEYQKYERWTKLSGAPCELQLSNVERCCWRRWKVTLQSSPSLRSKSYTTTSISNPLEKLNSCSISKSRNLNMNMNRHPLWNCWKWCQWSQTCRFCKTWPVQCWTFPSSHSCAILSSSADLTWQSWVNMAGRGWHRVAWNVVLVKCCWLGNKSPPMGFSLVGQRQIIVMAVEDGVGSPIFWLANLSVLV